MNTNNPIPAFGLGTFRLKGQVVIDSVKNGLDVGYRVIDTAQIYGNEAEVGRLSARNGVAAYALDPEAAARLWQVSVDTLAG